MPRFGTFTFGAPNKFGSTAATEGGEVAWIINVDWNNDGIFDGENEAGYCVGLNSKRGQEYYIQDKGGGFEALRPGKCTLTMDNKDRRYDPRNTSSPLYDNIVPGRKVYIAAHDLANNVTYSVFTGRLDDIVPLSDYGGGQVRFDVVGYFAQLSDQRLTASAAAINTTISGAYASLLADAQYPGAIDIEADTQPVYVFAVADQYAGDVSHDLAVASLGRFFVDADGTAKFYKRNHTYSASTALNSSQCHKRIKVSQPWSGVYSYVSTRGHYQIKEQPSIIYFLPYPKEIGAGETKYITARHDAATDVVVDGYAVNTDPNGTGTDITSDVAVTVFAQDVQSMTYEAVSASGSAGYITSVTLRGRRWREIQEEDNNDTASGDMRRFYYDSPYLQDANYVDKLGDAVETFVATNRADLTVRIDQRPDLQFGFDLYTPVAFTSSALDFSSEEYHVIGIEHDWNLETGQDTTTTLWLAKILTNSTSITPNTYLEEQIQAPLGYDNPAGDSDTIEAISSSGDDSPYALDHIIRVESEALTSAAEINSTYSSVIFSATPDVSDDILVDSVWTSDYPDRFYLTKPGAYRINFMVMFSPAVTYTPNARASTTARVQLYGADDALLDSGVGSVVSMKMIFGDFHTASLSTVISTSFSGTTVAFIRIGLTNLTPAISAAFTVNIYNLSIARINRTTQNW